MNSKTLIQNTISGWEGRQAAHYICYNGDGHVHRAIPYNALDPKVITKQFELMQLDGIDIVIGTWQGPWATACNTNAILVSSMCAQFGMQFALLLDPGGMQKWVANPTSATTTANVISALQASTTQTMLNASSYVPEHFVLDFGTGANLEELSQKFPNLNFLAQGIGFSWISIPSITDSPARNVAAVANLKTQHGNPVMKIASYWSSFDDSGMPLPVGVQSQLLFDKSGGVRDYDQSVWATNQKLANGNWKEPARILESFSGQLELQTLQTIPVNVPIIARGTWGDYDEQSSGPREKVVAEEQGVNWSTL